MPENQTISQCPPASQKTGVLLVNLGTPEATSYWPMRAYLKEFLSDPRVIEANRLVWWFVLNVIILTFRPRKSGHAYDLIWNREKNESPLKTYTRAQAEKLSAALGDPALITVDWAMRYGKPPIAGALEKMKQDGCERILVMPLYPQYSATTTASVFDKTAEAMRKMRWQPTLRFLPPFYHNPGYIRALASRTRRHLALHDWMPERIIVSYHGLPKDYVDKGDPYYCHCLETSRLLRAELGYTEKFMITTFQSRVGRSEWLRPYTDETVRELAQSGVKNLAILSPAFISDCVETLEELAVGAGLAFTRAGGENFSVIPCLNDSREAIDLLADLARNELKGWR